MPHPQEGVTHKSTKSTGRRVLQPREQQSGTHTASVHKWRQQEQKQKYGRETLLCFSVLRQLRGIFTKTIQRRLRSATPIRYQKTLMDLPKVARISRKLLCLHLSHPSQDTVSLLLAHLLPSTHLSPASNRPTVQMGCLCYTYSFPSLCHPGEQDYHWHSLAIRML